MSGYNIFNNIISNTSTIDANVRSIAREEIVQLEEKFNSVFKNECYIEVKINGIEGKYIESSYKKSMDNNYFVNGNFNIYILNNKVIIYKNNGWYFLQFSTNPKLIINLPIDLSVYIENEIFITNETKYFGSSSYPKNINILYI